MSRIVVSEFVSLDGVMEDPKWTMPYWNDEIAAFKYDELFASDALLLGRVTYEGFAESWPSQSDEAGFADRMNSVRKYVVSSTLERPEWNNSTVISGDLEKGVGALAQQPGQDVMVAGSATLVHALLDLDLVDELRLAVYPVVLGKGLRLFAEGTATSMRLVHQQATSTGVLLLAYGRPE